MAFRDFSYPEVRQTFGLTLSEVNLFARVQPFDVSEPFAERIQARAGLVSVLDTEKAKSEFIIAPVLIEVWEHFGRSFGMFTGVEFEVDAKRGLNGFCDFLFTRSPIRAEIIQPVLAIVESKNDSIPSGLGQCIAEMVAAREYNATGTSPSNGAVYGVVTTGERWKFLRLHGSDLTLDSQLYMIADLTRIMGILSHILTEPS